MYRVLSAICVSTLLAATATAQHFDDASPVMTEGSACVLPSSDNPIQTGVSIKISGSAGATFDISTTQPWLLLTPDPDDGNKAATVLKGVQLDSDGKAKLFIALLQTTELRKGKQIGLVKLSTAPKPLVVETECFPPTEISWLKPNADVAGDNRSAKNAIKRLEGSSVDTFAVSVNAYVGADGWLSATPASGGISGDSKEIKFAINPNVQEGDHTAYVQVTAKAAGAQNDPENTDYMRVDISVSRPEGAISLSEESLSLQAAFGGGAVSRTVNIISTGGNTRYSATARAEGGLRWLSVQPTGGTTDANPNLQIVADPRDLPIGAYKGSVVVTGVDPVTPEKKIAISFDVKETAPNIVMPETMTFVVRPGETEPKIQHLPINGGDGMPLTASVSTEDGGKWLDFYSSNGVRLPYNLNVIVNPSGLKPDTYIGKVTAQAPGVSNSPQSTRVVLHVTDRPEIVAPTDISVFQAVGETAPERTLEIRSNGGPADYAVTIDAGTGNWLTALSALAGTTPGKVVLRFRSEGLKPGKYEATITTQSTAAINSPLTTKVVYTLEKPTLRLNTQTPLPNAIAGRPFQFSMSASGGSPPYRWSSTDPLPKGLELMEKTGTLIGVPTQPSASVTPYNLRIRVTDSAGTATEGGRTFLLRVGKDDKALKAILSPKELPAAIEGWPYSYGLEATGPALKGAWQLVSGDALGNYGLSIDSSGNLSGIPSKAGTLNFRLRYGSTSQQLEQDFVLRIVPLLGAPLTMATSRLASAAAGASYVQRLDALGGTPPYTWGIDPETPLPAGLKLKDRSIAGQPESAGNYPVLLRVTDGAKAIQTAWMVLAVSGAGTPYVNASARLPLVQTGVEARAVTKPLGGGDWKLVAGTLPEGLGLRADGALEGRTWHFGVYSFTVESNSGGPVRKTFTLVVPREVTLTPEPGKWPAGKVGKTYELNLQASGGAPPYSYMLEVGKKKDSEAIPGLKFNGNSGSLTGTPTQAGVFPAGITVWTPFAFWDSDPHFWPKKSGAIRIE